MSAGTSSGPPGRHWLVLVHQFQQEPGSLRVKIWRCLQDMGAIHLRKSLYVLPHTEQCLEDFEWIRRELIAGGAEATILEASFLAGMTEAELRALFDDARDRDYAALAAELRVAKDEFGRKELPTASRLARFRRRLAEITTIDFFGANGRESVEGLLAEYERAIHAKRNSDRQQEDVMSGQESGSLQRRQWVTRRNVHVDRMASAWLIRRWIDPEARFRFVTGDNYAPAAGEVRFDMYEAEFTHVGDKCTFEVLRERFAGSDQALACIAEIVHDIDLRENKYGREESAGVARLLAGISAAHEDDESRLASSAQLFDALYRSYAQ